MYTPDGFAFAGTARRRSRKPYALGYTYGGVSDYAVLPKFEARSFPLNTKRTHYHAADKPGYENLLRFQVDTTTAGQTGTNSSLAGGSDDYAFGGAIVTPLDIRIEAMLYAQERSFFVIPGYPFNPDRSDTPQAYAHARAERRKWRWGRAARSRMATCPAWRRTSRSSMSRLMCESRFTVPLRKTTPRP